MHPRLDADRSRALLTGLIDDARGDVAAYRALRTDRDAVGSLLVRVSRLGGLLDELDAAPAHDPVPLVLVADTGLVEAGEARSILLDDDRVELAGVDVSLPPDGPPADAARLVLDTLDLAVPATLHVPPSAGWDEAVAVIAADGAESVGLDGSRDEPAPRLVACVREGAAVRVDGLSTGSQVLGVLAGVAAALEGREPAQVAALLAEPDPGMALAVLADAAPAALRRRLLSVRTTDPDAVLAELSDLGLAED